MYIEMDFKYTPRFLDKFWSDLQERYIFRFVTPAYFYFLHNSNDTMITPMQTWKAQSTSWL